MFSSNPAKGYPGREYFPSMRFYDVKENMILPIIVLDLQVDEDLKNFTGNEPDCGYDGRKPHCKPEF